MLYLIDANVVIDANRDYYQINRVPIFWEWLAYQCELGNIKMPQENYDEVTVKNLKREEKETKKQQNERKFLDWMRSHKAEIILNESPQRQIVDKIKNEGYAPNLTAEELVKIGQDPFLTAYAYASRDKGRECTIITTEISKSKKTRANKKIPDVCAGFDIPCFNTWHLIDVLDFTTSWQR